MNDDSYRVAVVKPGRWDRAPGFEMFWMEPNVPDEPLALVGVVIRGNGRNVLINTGPDPDYPPTMNARWAGFDPATGCGSRRRSGWSRPSL